MVICMESIEFGNRLAQLRITKGVSARKMSLALGQHKSYINTIENGKSFPSMQVFFYICDYLDISPEQFFQTNIPDPGKLDAILEMEKSLSSEELDVLISMIRAMKK